METKHTLLEGEPPITLREIIKVVAMCVVAGAVVAKPNFDDGSPWEIFCEVVIGMGAVFGIGSSGSHLLKRLR
jgi:hypothetical protein